MFFFLFDKAEIKGSTASSPFNSNAPIASSTTKPTDKYGYIQVERLEEGNAYLRCGWQNSRLVGFDSRNVGSYIYANKTSPGEFILEDIDEEGDGVKPLSYSPDGKSSIYDLHGRKIESLSSERFRGGRIVIERNSNGQARKVLIP